MNWIKTGWGPSLQQEFSPILPYVLDCSNIKITNRDFISIAIDFINKIVNEYPEPYYLMASGGVDTQAMIYCWLQAKKKFRILSYYYNEIYNQHDLKTLNEFASNFDLDVEYRNFDLINFLDTDLMKYALEYQTTSPQMCAFMSICDKITDGTIIFSGNLLELNSPSLNYTILGMDRYAKKRKNMIPFFFQHDSELACSLFPHLIKNKILMFSYQKKVDIYKKFCNVPVIAQETKYSGYEQIKNLYDTRYDLVTPLDKLQFSRLPSKRIFDIHYRYKLTKLIKYVDTVEYILPKSLIDMYYNSHSG